MKILFVGDVMLGRLVNRALRNRPPEYPWGDTLPVFKGADLRVCNLECVISDRGVPWSMTPKPFHFRADSRNVKVLKAAGIDALSLANNHILDFEYEAMFDTIEALDSAGIRHAGAGGDIREASRPAVFPVNEKKVGLFAFTDNEPSWKAREKRPGVFHLGVDADSVEAGGFFEKIRETARGVDVLIVSAHWGPNWGRSPVKGHPPFARALVDAGADIVFGHSCHVFQGVELYEGGVIIYGAGDFIDDYAVDEIERNDESFIYVVDANAGGAEGGGGIRSVHLYPTVIDDFHASLAKGDRALSISKKMQRLCLEFNTPSSWNAGKGRLEISLKI